MFLEMFNIHQFSSCPFWPYGHGVYFSSVHQPVHNCSAGCIPYSFLTVQYRAISFACIIAQSWFLPFTGWLFFQALKESVSTAVLLCCNILAVCCHNLLTRFAITRARLIYLLYWKLEIPRSWQTMAIDH